MIRNQKSSLIKIILTLFVLSMLVACAPVTVEEPPEQNEPEESVTTNEEELEGETVAEPTTPMEPQEVITWTQYDQNNEDAASDERVGNEYMRKAIPMFNEEYSSQYVWNNVFKPWDRAVAELVQAVLADGDVPDLLNIGTDDLPNLYINGAAQDLRTWAEQQSWWGSLNSSAINACTGPDGGLYCIPLVSKPYVTYVWADHFPNGWPETPEEFYVDAERLKNDGVYAMALFGSTAYDGTGAARGIWSIIASFGGTYSDNDGNMVLNTPENVAAIEFLRDITSKGYLSDTSFAGGFQEEESFKDASAASIPTGLFGYRYINPLTAPDGTKYEKGTYEDMLDAIADGKVIMSPMFAPNGMTPSCGIQADAYVLPTGAKNVEGAYALINWWMSNADIYAEYVIGPGAGFPVNNDYRDHPTFQEPFYKAAAEAIDKSECRSFIGTLTNPVEARTLVMNAIYKLIKEDPTADIATELQKVQEEYNANN